MNIKTTEVMTTEEIHNFNIDNKDTENVKDCAYFGSDINSKGGYSQEIKKRLRFGRAAVGELGKITKSKDMSLETKFEIIHILIFPTTMYSWTVQKIDSKRTDSFKTWCWKKALWILWTTRKVNR